MNARKIDLGDLDGVLQEVERLHKAGYEKAGKWDLSECLSHLGHFMKYSLEGFPFKLNPVLRFLGPFLLKGGIKKRQIRAGFKTAPPLEPQVDRDEAAMVAWFKEIVQRVKDHQGEFAVSPLAGRLSRQQWYDLHVIHSSLHLGFLNPKN